MADIGEQVQIGTSEATLVWYYILESITGIAFRIAPLQKLCVLTVFGEKESLVTGCSDGRRTNGRSGFTPIQCYDLPRGQLRNSAHQLSYKQAASLMPPYRGSEIV